MIVTIFKKIPSTIHYIFATLTAILITALIEYSFGRTIICKCNSIKLWHGVTQSSENSQQISDWYTFSHIIHGFGFYYLGKYLLKKLSLWQSFLLALTIESVWEVVENSSFIIERYRAATISLDYYGDSILNSAFDIIAMTLGFYLAKKAPIWAILSLIILFEIAVGYIIRDNLSLNIIMLLYPIDAIKQWQMGN